MESREIRIIAVANGWIVQPALYDRGICRTSETEVATNAEELAAIVNRWATRLPSDEGERERQEVKIEPIPPRSLDLELVLADRTD